MSLKEKYHGKNLTTDEVAEARNSINQEIKDLESISYITGADHILLKWGTLKSWDLNSDEGKKLLQEYFELPNSASAMLQKDTDRQKELICLMIEECDGVLKEDWNGNYLTKKEAKEYVMSYANNK